jgi:hypothetical protein
MPRRKDTITGLHIQDQYISCAQGLPDERFIANISIQPIEERGGDHWSAIESGFAELVEEIKLANQNVIASLPGDYAVIREFFVDADEADVENAIEWEFSQQIIGSRDDYVFDFQQFPSSQDDIRRYLVAAYRKEAVDRLSRMLRSAKLNPSAIDLDVFALINVYEMNYPDRLDDPVCIIAAEEGRAQCVLTRNGAFAGIETVTIEAQGEHAEYAGLLEETCRRIRTDYESFAGQGGPRWYLSGSMVGDAEFVGHVQPRLEGSELLFPFRSISCSAEMQDEELQKKYGPQLAVAIGLALRGE